MDNPLIRQPLSIDTYLEKFQRRIEEKYGLKFENYFDFHNWSCENYPKLWEETWNYFDIICSKTYDQVVDENTEFADVPDWFRGARLNFAENLLRYPHDDHVAIIATGEEKRIPEHVTFGQLRADVALWSSAFRKAGIKQGDAIACFISNRKEAVISLLAAASVGGLFSAINPLMGVNAIVSRFQQISPKVLVTIDRFVYDNEERKVLEVLPEIARDLPTLKHVIIVPSKEDSVLQDISFIPNSCFLPDFLKTGLMPDGSIPPLEYDQLPFNHPLIINYTSGTTGPPKGIVHSAGAALLSPMSNLSLHLNIGSNDVILAIYSTGWVTWNFFVVAIGLGAALVLYEGEPFFQGPTSIWDLIDEHKVTSSFLAPVILEELEKRQFLPGWVTWNAMVPALGLGAPMVLYEGDPFFRSPTSFWDLIDEHKVTSSMITPSILEKMEKMHFVPGKHNSLKSLHTLYSGSSRTKAHTYDFVYKQIKPDVFYSEIFGSTEFMTMFAGLNHKLPVYKEQIQVRTLGVDMRCYNEEGKPVLDEKGELVITKPFPSMPLYFWNDELKTTYRKTFFSRFPGVWWHGDICAISSKTGGMTVFGRSDETIKQRGARFGSSEIYNVMNSINEVSDSLCVSRVIADGNEIAYLFVKMKDGHSFNEHLEQKIRNKIRSELSAMHVPEIILCTPAIPYNLNGKKMEVLVKKILAGAKIMNKDNISNPDCLPYYGDVPRMNLI